MNRRCVQSVLAAVALAGVIQCAGPRVGAGFSDDTPDEMARMIRQSHKEGLYAVGSAMAGHEAVAQQKAVMQARGEIARQFKSQIDVLQKGYIASVNGQETEDYAQVMEVFATLEMCGSAIAKTMARRERDGSVTVKALVVVSATQLKALVDEKLQGFTAYKASEAYRELEERVHRERQLAGG